MDSSQTFYVEDGHIVYEGAPVEGGVVYNNGNSSSGGSTSSDRLPLARWSPTTATTTITTGDDDDSSSSKQHVIIIVTSSLRPNSRVSVFPQWNVPLPHSQFANGPLDNNYFESGLVKVVFFFFF